MSDYHREQMAAATMVGAKETPAVFDPLELEDREHLIKLVRMLQGQSSGVALMFNGKRSAMEIAKRVRPRQMRLVDELSMGSPEERAKNMVIEGENLQAMVTLYKYRGQVDLIVTDPPYNTGQYFRYNDKWEEDPNDPDLGTIVSMDDGSRHTKWIKSIMPRLQMMKAMLKPGGVIAICMDDNELFHLGMMMNEVFGEKNRLGIINWQKTSSKGTGNHVAKITEYVLVYAKDSDIARSQLLGRTDKSNSRFRNPDNDPNGRWKQGDPTAPEQRKETTYAIQSPFTGEFHYPRKGHWRNTRPTMKAWLEEWGSSYESKDLNDSRGKALVIKGYDPDAPEETNRAVLRVARTAALGVLARGTWPKLYFGADGASAPNLKIYESSVKTGAIPMTYWDEDFYVEPYELGCVSWAALESGRTRDGTEELKSLFGSDEDFETVKPLRLIKEIIQIWAPPNGLVLDPYAGSGTTGQAILELNQESEADRRFILIEQGRPENGDKYARTLTAARLIRAIRGERVTRDGTFEQSGTPLSSGFEFFMLTNQIDAATVLSMRRDELIDVVITSHWENGRRGGPTLIRISDPQYKYLVGRNEQGEGYFLIWDGEGPVGQLDSKTYRLVLKEGKKAGLRPPHRVYARYEVYQSPNVLFYKIPDKILAHLGLNENSDRFNLDDELGG